MTKRYVITPLLLLGAFSGITLAVMAQKSEPDLTVFHVTVNLVQLDVAVTDKKGSYVTKLGPENFEIYEDGIRQKIATFGEENEVPRKLEDLEPGRGTPGLAKSLSAKNFAGRNDNPSLSYTHSDSSNPAPSLVAGASVFILFDTSNYMYRGFVYAQDAIAQFVRSLDHPDRVAFYSYSRNFSRACLLTPDRLRVVQGVRTTVAGDNAALYDSLLLTLRDAVKVSGRKVVVVFSNGPDNSSVVGPEDVRELAQTEGIPIYMISTREARLDPLSTAIFERVSATTGGKAYFAKSWRDQAKAFASIRDDLAHLYSLSYYPQANPNRGWRTITVKLVGPDLKKCHVRTRSGYRPRAVRVAVQKNPAP